jgi:long-chain acyl-CoA synthetase
VLVALLEPSLGQSIDAAMRVRRNGNVPLIGDYRWEPEFWASLIEKYDSAPTPPGVAWAAFSGGSTGSPRVIIRTHESWQNSFAPLNQLLQLTADDTFYAPGSTASSMTLFSIAHAQDLGADLVLGASVGVHAADLSAATFFHGTSTSFEQVLALLERGNPSQLRVALVGGENTTPQLRARAQALGITVVAYYGAAELSFVAIDPDGCGLQAFPGVELELRDGILWSRSGYQSLGYLDGVAGALQKDDDGWATVGDIAVCESVHVLGSQEDRYRILGRSDGAILTAGATVIPEEVEAVLNQIDGVQASVVFGLATAGGILVAALIERSSQNPAHNLEFFRQQTVASLSPTHRPRIWFETTEIPRTAGGKIARNLVAQLAIQNALSKLQ